MIIAIMGATYDKVRDSKESNEREMKIDILSDYIRHIKLKNVKGENSFLVVVMSDEENFSSSEFDGTINMIRASISIA